MPYAIGTVLASLIALFLRATGFDRDRAVYPTLLIVIALYYVLFAVMGGSVRALGLELVAMLVFAVGAVLGFRISLWWAVAALAGHGVFDFFHGRWIANPGVPAWWPAFCGAYDVIFAAWLAGFLIRRRLRARGPESGIPSES
ncbi:MAG: hypothetical protein ACREOU_01565 [Candidatus Eiseniibacteriota bacterium]